MLRAFTAVLTLATIATAAPVPKAIKKSSAPSLVGTTWVGVHDGGGIGTVEYVFKEGGELVSNKRGGASNKNTWAQDGDTVTWSVNSGYANYTFTYKDGVYEGTALNVKGVTWKVKLTPKETK